MPKKQTASSAAAIDEKSPPEERKYLRWTGSSFKWASERVQDRLLSLAERLVVVLERRTVIRAHSEWYATCDKVLAEDVEAVRKRLWWEEPGARP